MGHPNPHPTSSFGWNLSLFMLFQPSSSSSLTRYTCQSAVCRTLLVTTYWTGMEELETRGTIRGRKREEFRIINFLPEAEFHHQCWSARAGWYLLGIDDQLPMLPFVEHHNRSTTTKAQAPQGIEGRAGRGQVAENLRRLSCVCVRVPQCDRQQVARQVDGALSF